MAASINDKITETFNGQNPASTTVANSRSLGGTTLVCQSLVGWPTNTAIHFATYQKDSTGAKIAGSQTDWKGVVSGSSINTLTRQGAAADSGNGIGDIVEMMPTYSWANDLAKGLENTLNQDGTIKTGLSPTFNNVTATGIITPTGGLSNNSVTAASLATNTISLGYAALGTDFSTATTGSLVTVSGLTLTVTVPAGGRDLLLIACLSLTNTSGGGAYLTGALVEGSTVLAQQAPTQTGTAAIVPITLMAKLSAPSVGSHTYLVQVGANGGTTKVYGSSGYGAGGLSTFWAGMA